GDHQGNDQCPEPGDLGGVYVGEACLDKRQVHAREHNISEQGVDTDHQHQGKQCKSEWHGIASCTFCFCGHSLLVVFMNAVAFSGHGRLASARMQPREPQPQHDEAANDAKPRCGENVSTVIRNGDGVLNGRRARQGGHGEGEGTQRDGGGDETLGNVGYAEQVSCDRVDGKGYDKQGYAAIGENAAGEYHGDDRVLFAQSVNDPARNGFRGAGVGHEAAKQGAKQEDGQKLHDVSAQGLHEGVCINGQKKADIAGEQNSQGGHERREKQNSDSAIRQIHQQYQGENDCQGAGHEEKTPVVRSMGPTN